jgi:transposase-like protein
MEAIAAVPVVETEVTEKAKRRGFTAEYKRRMLAEVDACTKPGEVGALLRREGLYSSHLAAWRQAARERGATQGLEPRKRGPKALPKDARDGQIAELERKAAKLEVELERAKTIIEIQKKVAFLLGSPLPKTDEES